MFALVMSLMVISWESPVSPRQKLGTPLEHQWSTKVCGRGQEKGGEEI